MKNFPHAPRQLRTRGLLAGVPREPHVSPMSLEREERVLRILANPARVDALTKEAYKAQCDRMDRLGLTLPVQATDATPIPCPWVAGVEGEPA